MKKTHYDNVVELVDALSDDRAFVREFDGRLSERQFVKSLIVLRTKAGLSQKELAERLGCTQSKISKLESSKDCELGFGDVINYSRSVGHDLRFLLVPSDADVFDEIELHACIIKRLAERFADYDYVTGVIGKFLADAAENLIRAARNHAAELRATETITTRPRRVLPESTFVGKKKKMHSSDANGTPVS